VKFGQFFVSSPYFHLKRPIILAVLTAEDNCPLGQGLPSFPIEDCSPLVGGLGVTKIAIVYILLTLLFNKQEYDSYDDCNDVYYRQSFEIR
jgi:hypothetical protein